MEQEFVILYTHQKTKKAKTWQDGTLKVHPSQNRAVLYDEKKSKLDALYVRPDQVCAGEELESDRYLIQVEEEVRGGPKATPPPQPARQTRGPMARHARYPAPQPGTHHTDTGRPPNTADASRPQAPQGLRVGLKRKKGGFIPPRQVKAARPDPTPCEEEPPMTALQVLQAKKARLTSTNPQPTIGDPSKPSLFNMYSMGQNNIEQNPPTTLETRVPAYSFSGQPRVDLSGTEGLSGVTASRGSQVGIDRGSLQVSKPAETIRPELDYSREPHPDPVGSSPHSEMNINIADEKRSTRTDDKALRLKAHPPRNVPDTSQLRGAPSNNRDSAADENKAPLCGTASNLVEPDSHDSGDFLLSQDSRGSLSVYNRVLSTINTADGPSPWSMVGRRKRVPIIDNNRVVPHPAHPDGCGAGVKRNQGGCDQTGQDFRGDPSSKSNSFQKETIAAPNVVPPHEAPSRGAKRNASQILALIKGNDTTKGQVHQSAASVLPTESHIQNVHASHSNDSLRKKTNLISTLRASASENVTERYQEKNGGKNIMTRQAEEDECDWRRVGCEVENVEEGVAENGRHAAQEPTPVPPRNTPTLGGPNSITSDTRPDQHQSPHPALMDEDIKPNNGTGGWRRSQGPFSPAGALPQVPPLPPTSHDHQMAPTPGTDISGSAFDADATPGADVAVTDAGEDMAACFDLSFSPLSHASFSEDESYTASSTPQPDGKQQQGLGVSVSGSSTTGGAGECSSSTCHPLEEQFEGPAASCSSRVEAVNVGIQDRSSDVKLQDGTGRQTEEDAPSECKDNANMLTRVEKGCLDKGRTVGEGPDEGRLDGTENKQLQLLDDNPKGVGNEELTIVKDHSPLISTPSPSSISEQKTNPAGSGPRNAALTSEYCLPSSEDPSHHDGGTEGHHTGGGTVRAIPGKVRDEGRGTGPSPVVTGARPGESDTAVGGGERPGRAGAGRDEDGPRGGRVTPLLQGRPPSPPRPEGGAGGGQGEGLPEVRERGADSRHGPAPGRLRPDGGRPHQTANPSAQPAIDGDGDAAADPGLINGRRVNVGRAASTQSASSAFVGPSSMAAADSGADSGHPAPAHRGDGPDKSAANKTHIRPHQSHSHVGRANNEPEEAAESNETSDLYPRPPQIETQSANVGVHAQKDDRTNKLCDVMNFQSDYAVSTNKCESESLQNESTKNVKLDAVSTAQFSESSPCLSEEKFPHQPIPAHFSPRPTHAPNRRLLQDVRSQDVSSSPHPESPDVRQAATCRLQDLEFSPEIPFTYDNPGRQPSAGNGGLGKAVLKRGWAALEVPNGVPCRIDPGGRVEGVGTRQLTTPSLSSAAQTSGNSPQNRCTVGPAQDRHVGEEGLAVVDGAPALPETACDSQWSELSDFSMEFDKDLDVEPNTAVGNAKRLQALNDEANPNSTLNSENKQYEQQEMSDAEWAYMPSQTHTSSRALSSCKMPHSTPEAMYNCDVRIQDEDSLHPIGVFKSRPQHPLLSAERRKATQAHTQVSLKERLTLGIYKIDPQDRTFEDNRGGGSAETGEVEDRGVSVEMGKVEGIGWRSHQWESGPSLVQRTFPAPHPTLSRYSGRPGEDDPSGRSLSTEGRPPAATPNISSPAVTPVMALLPPPPLSPVPDSAITLQGLMLQPYRPQCQGGGQPWVSRANPSHPTQLVLSHTPTASNTHGNSHSHPNLPAAAESVSKKYSLTGAVVSDTVHREDQRPTLIRAVAKRNEIRQEDEMFIGTGGGLYEGDSSLYSLAVPGLLKPRLEPNDKEPFVFSPIQISKNADLDSPSQEVPVECLPEGLLASTPPLNEDGHLQHLTSRVPLNEPDGLQDRENGVTKSMDSDRGDDQYTSYGDFRLFGDAHDSFKDDAFKAPGGRDSSVNETETIYRRPAPVSVHRPDRTTESSSRVGAGFQRRPLRSQPFTDQVVHTSYNRCVPVTAATPPMPSAVPSPTMCSSPAQVVPVPPQTHQTGGSTPANPFRRPAWMGPQPSPGDLSFLDSPLGPVSQQCGNKRAFCGGTEDEVKDEVGPATRSLRNRVLNYGQPSNSAANTTGPQRKPKPWALEAAGGGCNVTGSVHCRRDGPRAGPGRAAGGWSTGVTDEWGLTQESDASSRSSSQEGDGLTAGQLLCPDGASSKWDAFREEEEGVGEEGALLHFYHSRFSPQPPAADSTPPLPPATPLPPTGQTLPEYQRAGQELQSAAMPDMEDEWQDDFLVSDLQEGNNVSDCDRGRGQGAPAVSEAPGAIIHSPELFSQTDLPSSSRGDTPTPYQSHYVPPPGPLDTPSPGPVSYFPDTPHTSPGVGIPEPATRGRFPRFRAPRPVGGAPEPGRGRGEGWAGRPRPGSDPIGPRDPGPKGQNPPALTQASSLCGELRFPGGEEVGTAVTPQRQAVVPVTFSSVPLYRQALTQALREHLNIQLFELSRRYHTALSQADTSDYEPASQGSPFGRRQGSPSVARSTNPPCQHGQPCKMVQVKKPGANQGRFFFTCASERSQQCGFFKWAEDVRCTPGGGRGQTSGLKLSDSQSITSFLRGARLAFYCECQLIRKSANAYKRQNIPIWVRRKMGMEDDSTEKKLFLKLPRKEASSAYAKDDLWVVTQQLDCDPAHTLVARSTFYGPNQALEVEIDPIGRYSPSNWPSGALCHAIHVGNASSELSCLANLQEAVQPSTLPLLPHLINRDSSGSCESRGRFSAPRMQEKNFFFVPGNLVDDLAEEMVEKYRLNEDQSTALRRIAAMFASEKHEPHPPITLIHGVFGAGKSYLLAVVVVFLARLFAKNDSFTPEVPDPLKVLISSTTNVAVDRILLGLLELGHDDFVRVGSVKKIAKPILPYSVHAAGSDNQELKDLQDMLKSETLTPTEKIHVRRSIDQCRKGANKKKLKKVRIVGVTCAACAFQCLKDFKFPVVLLDECSQMTEPMSLLPIAKFGCHRLVLVGDPKQLDPTIQGSEPSHSEGLEQTLFDRLERMGHEAVMLRTQYRCHPLISAIPNILFYNKMLKDGITAADRPPLLPGWPALCFLDVRDGCEKSSSSGSFYNDREAELVVAVIDRLVEQGVEPSAIGVITLYKAQQARTAQLLQAHQDSELKAVQVSTVDAFQGGERDVILLSCVRTHFVGFIDSDKRTNVALSRAKNHLFIVGHRKNLTNNSLWRKVIKHCLEAPRGMQIGAEFLKSIGVCDRDRSSDVAGVTPCTPVLPLSDPSLPDNGTPPVTHTDDVAVSPPMDITPDDVTSDAVPGRTSASSRPRRSHLFNAAAFDESFATDQSDSDEDLPTYL